MLDDVAASFDAAALVGTCIEHYRIGGGVVEMRYASRLLRDRYRPAFVHLALVEPARTPDLTVHVWDSDSTGAPPPPRPESAADAAAGALYHFHVPPLRAGYQPGLEMLSIFESESRTAWHWLADGRRETLEQAACPMRQLLFWWLSGLGYLQVHGAAVGTPTSGALIVGTPGSGKSTTALACLDSDLLYAGDDYVAVALEPEPYVASLYASGKVDSAHTRRTLPHLLPLLESPNGRADEKAVLYVARHFPQQAAAGFPLTAVLIPVIRSRREPHIAPAVRAAAFAALAPSTMLQLHTAGPQEFSQMSSLVARVPCYTLELGSDVSRVPKAIGDLLSKLDRPN